MQDLTILALLKRLQDKVNSISKQVGPKGDQGPAGKDGVSIKGEKGDTGEMGVGQDGRDGEEGPAGKDGEDGVGISGVTLGIDDSIIFQLSNGDEASVELPLIQGSGDTIINKISGGSGGSGEGSATTTKRVIVTTAADFPTVLDSTVQYFIDGTVDMGTRSLEIPAGGIHLHGYDLELSVLSSTADNYTMFTSPVGGSGDVLGSDFAITVSGTNSQVYDIVDSNGFHAIEFAALNYIDCTSLGTIDSYRQGLETGSGRFGGSPSLTLKGPWVGGFRITTSIVRGLDAGMTEPLFKAGAGFTMASRFLTDINVDLPAGAALLDFSPANFANPSTVQLQGCIVTRVGVSDPTDTNLTPNIVEKDLAASFKNNQGLSNTHPGGGYKVTTEVATVVSVIDTYYTLAGTTSGEHLQHFSSPTDGQIRNDGNNPREFTVFADMTVEGTANDDLSLRLMKYDASAATAVEVSTQRRPVNNLSGGRDVAFFSMLTHVALDIGDYIYLTVANHSGTGNVTAELDSRLMVTER